MGVLYCIWTVVCIMHEKTFQNVFAIFGNVEVQNFAKNGEKEEKRMVGHATRTRTHNGGMGGLTVCHLWPPDALADYATKSHSKYGLLLTISNCHQVTR